MGDTATIAGATQRAAKAAEEQAAREAAMEDSDSDAEVSGRGGRSRRNAQIPGTTQDMDDEDVPLPGKEGEALPVSHEVTISGHNKPVTAVALDPKASRMVTGSLDGIVKFYDFNGMSEEKNSFRELEPVPAQGQHIYSLSFGTTGGIVLVVS